MNELLDKRLVDEAIDAYVDWREECAPVRDAYSRWTSEHVADSPLAFSAYRAAPDRAERAAHVYAELMTRVSVAVPAFQSTWQERAVYERDKPRMMEVTDPNRDLFSCMRGQHHQIVEAGGEGDRVRLSTGLMQLVAVDEMAATVAGLGTGAPVGGRVEVGGPEALGVDAWGRRLFAATGDERTVSGDRHARYFGTELHGGELTPRDGARVGTIDFETWFARHSQGARR